jgi:hypothetical protein
MRKFKFFINYDKEEKWINEMLKKGYELDDVSFGYKFSSSRSENATIRIDYRTFKKIEDFIEYCILFEDTGWRHIAGTKHSGKQYFKKISENSEVDIFSDNFSRAEKYKRLSDVQIALAICYLIISISSISSNNLIVKWLLNPKLLYLTPGLWQKTGLNFWRSFLFETPFAVLRGSIFLLIPLTLGLIYSSIKARILYNKQKRSI